MGHTLHIQWIIQILVSRGPALIADSVGFFKDFSVFLHPTVCLHVSQFFSFLCNYSQVFEDFMLNNSALYANVSLGLERKKAQTSVLIPKIRWN